MFIYCQPLATPTKSSRGIPGEKEAGQVNNAWSKSFVSSKVIGRVLFLSSHSGTSEKRGYEFPAQFLIHSDPRKGKIWISTKGVLMAEELKPGDYIGLYIDNVLIYTGVLKDQGTMQSGRKIYQVLLVKNIFQRNFPEIHFDADIRPATWEQVAAEIKRLKIKLQKNIEQMESNVEQLISEKELHNILG